jgi:Domain of unknown function (DUF309)
VLPTACPTDDELRDALRVALAHLLEGAYFEAHEDLEPVWLRAVGSARLWLQGIIQAAAGWYHLAHGRSVSAKKLLLAAGTKLGDGPDCWLGFPLGRVRLAVADDLATLERPPGAEPRLPNEVGLRRILLGKAADSD